MKHLTLFEDFGDNYNLPEEGDWVLIKSEDLKPGEEPTKTILTGKEFLEDFYKTDSKSYIGKVYYVDHYSTNFERKPLCWFILIDDDTQKSIRIKVYRDGIEGWGKNREDVEAMQFSKIYNL